jgi:hypothetical protein
MKKWFFWYYLGLQVMAILCRAAKNSLPGTIFLYCINATGNLLHSLYARELLYLKDQASWTSSQLNRVHIVTALVLTLPYLLSTVQT